MRLIESVKELKQVVKAHKLEGKTIGFVPTMGYLHEGHISLVNEAKGKNDITVVSIFVNPTQFGPNEDLDSYPRDYDRDAKLLVEAGVDYVFYPTVQEMYPNGYTTHVEVSDQLTKKLCGKSRDGHFNGVTTVVNKLFNMVDPDQAYFGLKDAQQVIVLQRMVEDLNMNVEIVPCPIVREEDGLAMSSRNKYLSETERKEALVLSKSLLEAKEMIENGEKSAEIVKQFIVDKIGEVSYAVIDYVEIVDFKNLEDVSNLEGKILIALAVKFGKPRLIDNLLLEVE